MSNTSFQLDTERPPAPLEYLNWIRDASSHGKGMVAMLREMLSLQRGPGKIQPEEYFLYQLYDDTRFTAEAKRTFMGVNCPLPASPWAEVVHDKPTLTALLAGLGFPVPQTQAIAHPERTFADARILRQPDDLRRFLREEADYPIFGKPFDGICSLGTAAIAGFDYAADALTLNDGSAVDLDRFVHAIRDLGFRYLFQSLLRPHPELTPIVGDRVCTVRMFVLSDSEGSHLLRASWKIPAHEQGADNFWRRGNILAGIDVETGRVVRTVRRTDSGIEPVAEHPLTGHRFADLHFPQWDAMRDVILRVAPNLPGCHFQGWDVALTDGGPVIVELEGDGGDPIMEQLCFDSGLLQGRFLDFLNDRREQEKEKKSKEKRRRTASLRRNLAALTAGTPGAEPTEPAEAAAQSDVAASDGEPAPSAQRVTDKQELGV